MERCKCWLSTVVYKVEVQGECERIRVPQNNVLPLSFIHSLLLDFSPEDFIDTESPVPPDPEQPDCTKILELPYSIHAFQHLRVSGEL